MDANPRRKRSTSFSFRLQLTKALQELESAVRDAQEHSWEEDDLARAREIAFSLAGAFRVEGLAEAAVMSKSLGCLLKLTRDQILPMDRAFREKLEEILAFLRETAKQVLTGTG